MSEHLISRPDAENDLLAAAAYLAESIQSNDGRAEAMKAVVPRYLAKGNVDLAAELSNTVDDPFVRDRLLIAVAETCAGMDDDEYALQLVEAMDDIGMQAQARERIGLKLAANGQIVKATTVADMMDHRDNVLAAIAIRQSADGDREAAVRTIGEIGFPFSAAHAWMAMAADAIEKEDFDRAAELLERSLEPAEEIEHEEERIRSFIDIGNSFLASNRNDRAIETLDKAREYAEALGNVHRDNFLASISTGFLRAGSVELADRTLDSVKDKTQIATALLGFAREFWRKEEKDEALEALEEAYAILKSQHERETRDGKARYALFANIAVQFAGFEKAERGIEIAQEIADENQAMSALGQIAKILTIQKNDELARTALNAIPDDAHRMFALISLSDAAVANDEHENAAGFLNEADALAEEVPQLASRSAAYNAIADRFLNLEDLPKAREIAHKNLGVIATIKDESSQVSSLAELAGSFEKAGFAPDEADAEIIRAILLPKRF